MPARKRRKPAVRVIRISPSELAARLRRQREKAKQARIKGAAEKAVRSFRPRKADRGSIVFIGRKGKRDAASKGRQGYTVFVDKRGKKHIIQSAKVGYRSFKITDAEIPETKRLSAARSKFIAARRHLTKSGNAVVKAQGSVNTGKGMYDFSDKVIETIAKSLKKAFDSQASQRRFLVNAMVLIRLADGTARTLNVQVEISKADHVAIEIGGLENFVRYKFYAFMAHQLAFHGFVSSGSANHIRRLPENKGVPRDEWTKEEKLWEGHDYETVHIEQIEWKIEQMK